jgi:hypothetical protein
MVHTRAISEPKHKSLTDWLTVIFTATIGLTGALALLYAREQISESHQQAQVQHLIDFDQRYEQDPMVSYRRAAAAKRLAGIEDPDEEDRMLDFFEMVALMANRGYLRDEDVWETFSDEIFPLYADERDTIEQDQKTDRPEYSNLVSLVSRMEAIEDRRGGTQGHPSKDDIRDFWTYTATVGQGTLPARHKRATTKPQ